MCGTLQWQIENISFSFPFLDHSSMTPVFHSPVCSVVLISGRVRTVSLPPAWWEGVVSAAKAREGDQGTSDL